MAITLSTEAIIGVIAGSVAGGILLLLVFGLCGYFCCCRSRRYNDKPPKRIPENQTNGITNRVALPPAKLGTISQTQTDEDMEAAKAVGYAYPIVGGRPVSYPYFGGANMMRQNNSPPSSTGAKTSNPAQRQPSVGLPPNAYRLPGLADKSFSMSDSNLSTVGVGIAGTINPAYDPNGDLEGSSRHVYRTQSLMNVDRRDADHQSKDNWKRSSYQPQYKSNVYQYDGLHGQVTNRHDGSSASSNRRDFKNRLSSFDEETGETSKVRNHSSYEDRRTAPLNIRVAHELEAVDQVYSLPNKQKKKAPEPPSFPKGLPRIPLEAPAEIEEPPKFLPIKVNTGIRRSLTSEMSYRAKGNLVTDQAFDFLDGYQEDDEPRS